MLIVGKMEDPETYHEKKENHSQFHHAEIDPLMKSW